MERDERRLVRGRLAALTALALAFCSCARAEPSFGALLVRLDAFPDSLDAKPFLTAAALAESTEDRLRLLKRARARSAELYAATAEAIMASPPVSEAVAMAALDAFLASGSHGEALRLFGRDIPLEGHGLALAEALVEARRAGSDEKIGVRELVACADATDDGRFLVEAAILELEAGDASAAATLLSDGLVSPESVPYRVYWDSGAHAALLARSLDRGDPLSILVTADAALELGLTALATSLYAEAVGLFPYWTWKPYAAMARLDDAAGTEPPDGKDDTPVADLPFETSPPAIPGERWYALMLERFPDSDDASLEYAAWLMKRGLQAEALERAGGVGEPQASIARLEYCSFDALAGQAASLLSAYPSTPEAVDAALAALARAGAWDRFAEALARAERDGAYPRRLWFWQCLRFALEGDPANAAELVMAYGPARGGYAGALDLGILTLAAGRPLEAARAFENAASRAASPEARADALVRSGEAYERARDSSAASAAYRAAIDADPGNRDARSRLERLSSH